MPTTEIAPGLTVTDEQYVIAADGLTQHAPELRLLTYDLWTSSRWTLIPDELTGRAYKATLTLDDGPRNTIVTLWFEPDLRGGAGPQPHNHPMDFHSRILSGYYVEDRYELLDGEVKHTPGVEHHVGDVNRIGREEYHEVVEIGSGTMTLMLCGPGMSPWGYLDLDTGETTPNVQSPRFAELLRELNPHQDR